MRAGEVLFERFILNAKLGAGGMGVVWKAFDTRLEQPIALKFLPPELAGDAAACTLLKREAQKAILLTHPHIVRVHDLHIGSGGLAVAMEWIDGGVLNRLQRCTPLGAFQPADLTVVLRQLLAGLEHAHGECGMIHRDLKPSNLMINRKGDLKITDFGIAASIRDGVARLGGLAGSGTPAYMSPQQLMGHAPSVTDDIYSLGATLFELLTGAPPFFEGDIIDQLLRRPAPPVCERRAEFGFTEPAIAPHWEAVIGRCLAKNPVDRPQSANEISIRLRLADTVGYGNAAGLLQALVMQDDDRLAAQEAAARDSRRRTRKHVPEPGAERAPPPPPPANAAEPFVAAMPSTPVAPSLPSLPDLPHLSKLAQPASPPSLPKFTAPVRQASGAAPSGTETVAPQIGTKTQGLSDHHGDPPPPHAERRAFWFSPRLLVPVVVLVAVGAALRWQKGTAAKRDPIVAATNPRADEAETAVAPPTSQARLLDSTAPQPPHDPFARPDGVAPLTTFSLPVQQALPLEGSDVLLIGPAALHRWSPAAPATPPALGLELRGQPDLHAFDPDSRALFLGYAQEGVTRVKLGDVAWQETQFAPGPVGGLACASAYVLAESYDYPGNSWRTLSVYTNEGRKVDSKDFSYHSNHYAWNAQRRLLYHFNDLMSPRDIFHRNVSPGGKLGKDTDSPYHGTDGISGPIHFPPDSRVVLLGSGRLFDATSLKEWGALRQIPPFIAAINHQDLLVTIAPTTDTSINPPSPATETIWYDRAFTRQGGAVIPGTPNALTQAGDGVLLFTRLEGTTAVFKLPLPTTDRTSPPVPRNTITRN